MMGFTNSFPALALIPLFTTILSLPTDELFKRDGLTIPIGTTDHLIPVTGPHPKIIQLTPAELASVGNVQGAPPSSSITITRDIFLEDRGVIGATDDRVLWNSTDFPYRAMGKLIRSDGRTCTGTLVGSRHVATAKHCAVTDATSPITTTFTPDYFDGMRSGWSSASVTVVISSSSSYDATKTNPTQCDYEQDWVVLILDQTLGNTYGYIGVKALATSQVGQGIFYHLGYPTDKAGGERQYRQYPVTVTSKGSCSAYGPLNTDADATSGQSGGPLWLPPDAEGLRYLYGVLSASSSSNSLFAGGSSLAAAVAWARNNYA